MDVSRKRTRDGGVVQKELKFKDVAIDDNPVPSAGVVFSSINLIAQGVSEGERIGRKCTLRKISWRYHLFLPEILATSGTMKCDIVRMILFQDKQCNGAIATVTGILETANFQSFYNLANQNRFVIHMDKSVVINAVAGAGEGTVNDWPPSCKIGYFEDWFNVPLEFDSTDGALTEIRSNNFGILLITAGGLADFQSNIRIRFSDY